MELALKGVNLPSNEVHDGNLSLNVKFDAKTKHYFHPLCTDGGEGKIKCSSWMLNPKLSCIPSG